MINSKKDSVPDSITLRVGATWQLFQKIASLFLRKKIK